MWGEEELTWWTLTLAFLVPTMATWTLKYTGLMQTSGSLRKIDGYLWNQWSLKTCRMPKEECWGSLASSLAPAWVCWSPFHFRLQAGQRKSYHLGIMAPRINLKITNIQLDGFLLGTDVRSSFLLLSCYASWQSIIFFLSPLIHWD